MLTIGNERFFSENVENVNRLTSKTLFFGNLVAPLCFLGNCAGIFAIPLLFIIKMGVAIFLLSIAQWLLVYVFKRRRLPMYFCMISLIFLIAYMGTCYYLGIYISYALVIFVSCLYYDVKLTRIVAVLSYLATVVSLYFKGCDAFVAGETKFVPLIYALRLGAGYLIEFAFCYFVGVSIAKRYRTILVHAIDRNRRLVKNQLDIMSFVPKMLESHELFTGHHVRHTVHYVELICHQLVKDNQYTGILNEKTIQIYSSAANLHDMGKIHIPDHILNKQGRYNSIEFSMMKEHPAEGKKLIDSLPRIDFGNFNEIAAQMAYSHHEKWDGTGYPEGLSGKNIPLCARIMAGADVLDALLSWRPYKQPFPIEQAMQIIKESSGTHFEPAIADAILEIRDEVERLSKYFHENELEDEENEFKWRLRAANNKTG